MTRNHIHCAVGLHGDEGVMSGKPTSGSSGVETVEPDLYLRFVFFSSSQVCGRIAISSSISTFPLFCLVSSVLLFSRSKLANT